MLTARARRAYPLYLIEGMGCVLLYSITTIIGCGYLVPGIVEETPTQPPESRHCHQQRE
jgi:hypothetical protein